MISFKTLGPLSREVSGDLWDSTELNIRDLLGKLADSKGGESLKQAIVQAQLNEKIERAKAQLRALNSGDYITLEIGDPWISRLKNRRGKGSGAIFTAALMERPGTKEVRLVNLVFDLDDELYSEYAASRSYHKELLAARVEKLCEGFNRLSDVKRDQLKRLLGKSRQERSKAEGELVRPWLATKPGRSSHFEGNFLRPDF